MINPNHEVIITLREVFYEGVNNIPYVRRTLSINDSIIAEEDYYLAAKGGALAQLSRQVDELASEGLTSQCTKCRYKVSNYPGNVSNHFYVFFRSSLRLKFLQLKLRLLQIVKKGIFHKRKSTSV